MTPPVIAEAAEPTTQVTPTGLPEEVRAKVELIDTDGEPLESDWHRLEIALLVESVKYFHRGRTDFYAGGNIFIYFDEEEARTRNFRGPDFFYVKGANRTPMRPYWVVWQEGGRYPNTIIELLSPKTALEDRTTKKSVYEKIFRTPDYFCYDPATKQLEGWHLNGHMHYQELAPNERGWLWSEELGLWVGTWIGEYLGDQETWLRFYDPEHRLVLTGSESEKQSAEAERQRAEAERQRAEAERQRAEAERQRANAFEAEIAKLKTLLAQHGDQAK